MEQKSYSSAIEEIKSRCNIVDVIMPLVPLKRAGSNYKGCCPFHNEKTPSFVVSETRQTYHCFGCGEHGDAIKFIQKYHNITFPEAVEKLAAQYGIQIETVYSQQGKKREPYYEANRLAARYFFDTLTKGKNKGLEYMNKRRITPETMIKFGIGYADDEWSSLTDYLKSKNISTEMMVELGLCSQKDKKVYDKFRGRVIFPIINTQGKVIGFGGRIIGEGEPKYLNSPESLVFLKKNNLYGLNLSRTEIQKEGYAILVEGYMDVVGLYQGGIKNVAASLGTALTPEQAKLLSRYTQKVVLCYDADNAGIKAALRGIDVLRGAGLEVKVLHVDDGKDPDEYIKKHGRDEFINLINKKAMNDIDYKMDLISKRYDINSTDGGIKFFRDAAAVLKELKPVEAEIYIKKVAAKYHISEGAMRSEVLESEKAAEQIAPAENRAPEEGQSPQQGRQRNLLEMTLLRLVLLRSKYFPRLAEFPDAVESSLGSEIFRAMERQYKEDEEFDPEEIKNGLSDEAFEYLKLIYKDILVGENDEKAFSDCIDMVQMQRRKQRIAEIRDILTMADNTTDPNLIIQLTLELQELSRKESR